LMGGSCGVHHVGHDLGLGSAPLQLIPMFRRLAMAGGEAHGSMLIPI
jgi:hypothetical protein